MAKGDSKDTIRTSDEDEFTVGLKKMQAAMERRATRLSRLNIATLCVAIGALLASVVQTCGLRRSVDAQVRATEVQWRPWLAVVGFEPPHLPGQVGRSPDPNLAEFRLVNVGPLPATEVWTRITSFEASSPPSFEQAFPTSTPKRFAIAASNQPFNAAQEVVVNEAAVLAAREKRTSLYICLAAEYVGPDKRPHVLRNCQVMDPDTRSWGFYPPPATTTDVP